MLTELSFFVTCRILLGTGGFERVSTHQNITWYSIRNFYQGFRMSSDKLILTSIMHDQFKCWAVPVPVWMTITIKFCSTTWTHINGIAAHPLSLSLSLSLYLSLSLSLSLCWLFLKINIAEMHCSVSVHRSGRKPSITCNFPKLDIIAQLSPTSSPVMGNYCMAINKRKTPQWDTSLGRIVVSFMLLFVYRFQWFNSL